MRNKKDKKDTKQFTAPEQIEMAKEILKENKDALKALADGEKAKGL